MTSPVQESLENFENLKLDAFESKDVFLDDSNDPNKNFCNKIQAIDTQYYFPLELLSSSKKFHLNIEDLPMVHINGRSAKKNFEKLFLKQSFFLKLYV